VDAVRRRAECREADAGGLEAPATFRGSPQARLQGEGGGLNVEGQMRAG